MTATADNAEVQRNLAGKLGITAGQVVQEIGYDDDCDEDLRAGVVAVSGLRAGRRGLRRRRRRRAALVARRGRRPRRRARRRHRDPGRPGRRLAADPQARARRPRRVLGHLRRRSDRGPAGHEHDLRLARVAGHPPRRPQGLPPLRPAGRPACSLATAPERQALPHAAERGRRADRRDEGAASRDAGHLLDDRGEREQPGEVVDRGLLAPHDRRDVGASRGDVEEQPGRPLDRRARRPRAARRRGRPASSRAVRPRSRPWRPVAKIPRGVIAAIEAVMPWRAASAPIVSTRPSRPLSSSASGTTAPACSRSRAEVASG